MGGVSSGILGPVVSVVNGYFFEVAPKPPDDHQIYEQLGSFVK